MFSRSLINIGAGVALAAVLALGSGAAAYAHECFIPNRSEQGNAKAGANSQAWYTLVVADAIQGDVGPEGITQAQADCILREYTATGAPSSFTVHVKGATGQDGTLAAHNPNLAKGGDGKGVDYIFAAYGEQIGGSYALCGAGG